MAASTAMRRVMVSPCSISRAGARLRQQVGAQPLEDGRRQQIAVNHETVAIESRAIGV